MVPGVARRNSDGELRAVPKAVELSGSAQGAKQSAMIKESGPLTRLLWSLASGQFMVLAALIQGAGPCPLDNSRREGIEAENAAGWRVTDILSM